MSHDHTSDRLYELDRTAFVTTENHLIIGVISAHGYRVHDILPTPVLSWGTIWHVIRVMFCPKVVTELMCGHQVCFLLKDDSVEDNNS